MLDAEFTLPIASSALRSGPEEFYDLRHQTVWAAILEMVDSDEPVDVISLQQHLKDQQLLEQVGGIAFIATLPDATPSAANAQHYADIVHEKYLLRKMIHVCTESVAKIYECESDVDLLVDGIERNILAVNRLRGPVGTTDIKALVRQAVTHIEKLWETNGALSGISTGFPDLDRKLDGLHGGEMIVLAGFPGSGKSSLALNIADHIATELKQPVGIFSMEMKAPSLISRIILARARVNSYDVRNRKITERDFAKITTAASAVAGARLFIDDSGELSIHELRARTRRWAQEHGIKFLVIDYLQLLHAAGGGRTVESRQQEVADISRGVKGLALDLNIPILALSQLNDDGKLRESRAIGQDADGVWRLQKKEGGTDTPQLTEIELDILKNRNGEVGIVNLLFQKIYTRFESVSQVPDTL
jgi:replicative DNA helicase